MRQCPRDEVLACYREAWAFRSWFSFGPELPKPCQAKYSEPESRQHEVLPSQTFSQPLFAGQGKTLVSPLANATIHGGDIGISHSLQGISRQRGAEPATAVQNHGGTQVG